MKEEFFSGELLGTDDLAATAEHLKGRDSRVTRELQGYGVVSPGIPLGGRALHPRTIATVRDARSSTVARLTVAIESHLADGLAWVVFEPNSEPTWAAVRSTVESFLLTLWRDGGLVGQTPEDAFFVRCDRTTMTDADIDAGRLVGIVGFAPQRPAEFITLRFTQVTSTAG
ncbi:phage tail sheath C-terminal domain-containing protein [Planococcus sp. APC 4015]|nr:phage tail sheath C-terminal domain-containing protein [Planococcus sp. APC 4015]